MPTENAKLKLDAVVCIPTFRRPQHLSKTLASLARQVGSVCFAVVVVENDAPRAAGKAVADAVFAAGELNGLCVVEANQGNCCAINRAFATARERYPEVEYFLMIDDDEVAEPNWLAEMVKAARVNGVDLVGGPVNRAFEATPDRGKLAHPLFNSRSEETGFIKMLHGSGNCLISRRVFEALDDPGFDLRFNFLGGGDMDFFTRCRKLGFKAYWTNAAIAIETVPKTRLSTPWLLHRAVTTGVINYTIDRKQHPGALGFVALLAKNVLTLPISLPRAARLYWATRHWLPASFPILVAVGRSLGAFGLAPSPYKG